MLIYTIAAAVTLLVVALLSRPLIRRAAASGEERQVWIAAAIPTLFSVTALGVAFVVIAPDAMRPPGASGPGLTRDGEPLHPGMDGMIADLEKRLAQNPGDAEGWALLARTYERTDRHRESLTAFAKAIELASSDRLLASEYAEARVIANDGVVDAIALDLFNRLLDSADPATPDIGYQARYYAALHRVQSGDLVNGLKEWKALQADAPAGAGWTGMLDAQIAEAEQALGGTAPSPPGGPNAEAMAAMSGLPETERAMMIEGMVARLAARLKTTPDDIDGWRQLARSYSVLGRDAEAVTAHERVLELDSRDPDALWAIAFAERSRGNVAEARRLLNRLIAVLPPNDPRRSDAEIVLAALR
jgi:cytochrome c-type biogenesis protein CcmH